MKSRRITDRLREPRVMVDHRQSCLGKEWFKCETSARRGWLHGAYRCSVCTGWHRTSIDKGQERTND